MQQKEIVKHLEKIYHIQNNDFRHTSLFKKIRKYFKNGNFLDVGCGSGFATLSILQSGFDIDPIDISPQMVTLTNQVFLKCNLKPKAQVLQINQLKNSNLKDKRYNNILCLDVLEHIENDQEAILETKKLLKKDGRLIITVPAIKKLYGKRDEKMGHYRRYSKKELQQKISKADLKIEKIFYWNFIGTIMTLIFTKLLNKAVNEEFRYKENFLNKLVNSCLKNWIILIENNIPLPIGLTLIVICKKDENS